MKVDPPPGRGRPENPRDRPIRTGGGKRRRGRRGRASSLVAFGDILRRNAKTLGLEPAIRLVEAREAWESIVGPALGGASRVISFRREVLMVSAGHPLVAQEIRLRRREILAALERRLGQAAARLEVVIRSGGKMG